MTQIETIIAEIERLKGVFVPTVNVEYQDFSKFLLDFVIDSINSLPEEQPSEDLDGEIKLYQLRNPVINHSEKSLSQLVKRVAIHFANWQKEQLMKNAIGALVDEDTENVGKKTLLLIGEQRDALNTQLSNYEYGETVKLVIIKEAKNDTRR